MSSIMKAIQACMPQSHTFLDWEEIEPLCMLYGIDTDVRSELDVAKNYLKTAELEGSVSAVQEALLGAAEFFPHLIQLLKVIITIPVSSASCERINSCLKRIKNCKRSTMLNDRLSDLTILSMNSDLISSINYDNVINIFAQKNRRAELL